MRLDQVITKKHNLFEVSCNYDGTQLNPSLFSYTNFPQTRQEPGPSARPGVISSSIVNETRFGYNYAYHLNAPISLHGCNGNWPTSACESLAGGIPFHLIYGSSGLHDVRLQWKR